MDPKCTCDNGASASHCSNKLINSLQNCISCYDGYKLVKSDVDSRCYLKILEKKKPVGKTELVIPPNDTAKDVIVVKIPTKPIEDTVILPPKAILPPLVRGSP